MTLEPTHPERRPGSAPARPRASPASRLCLPRGRRLCPGHLIVVLTLALGCGSRVGPGLVEVTGETMGTTYTVKVVQPTADVDPVALAALVREVLSSVDARMSTWRSDSELSRLNRHARTTPLPISPALLEVLTVAGEVSDRSGGAFDVTVSPLVDAWGFGPPGRPAQPPDAATVERLRQVVGWRKLILDPGAGTVTKAHPGVQVDLSAIAKGYGVDRTAEALEAAGYPRYMIEVGGEVRTRGLNSRREPWQIAIERPLERTRGLYSVVPLVGRSLATSGDYRNYYEVAGRRLSHTIDPRTGEPIAHRLASVSVVADRCTWADAWATALNVMGPEGVELAESEGIDALFLFRDDDGGFEEVATSGLRRLLGNAPPLPPRSPADLEPG